MAVTLGYGTTVQRVALAILRAELKQLYDRRLRPLRSVAARYDLV